MSNVEQVSVNEVPEGAFVLDVREDYEFEAGHVPGARHIPLGELQARLGEIPRGRPVVAYCGAGGRAASAVQILKRAGFPDVTNAGGLADLPR